MTDMTTVLLVDDDESMLTLFQLVLAEKYQVITAQSGKVALEQAVAVHPNFILLDIMMPEMNGLEVLDLLKSNSATADITVAILTNLADDQYKHQAIQKGAAAYLVKSDYDPDELLAIISKLIPTQ